MIPKWSVFGETLWNWDKRNGPEGAMERGLWAWVSSLGVKWHLQGTCFLRLCILALHPTLRFMETVANPVSISEGTLPSQEQDWEVDLLAGSSCYIHWAFCFSSGTCVECVGICKWYQVAVTLLRYPWNCGVDIVPLSWEIQMTSNLLA